MKNSTIYIKLNSESYETGDYRSGGTVTDYFKIYCCKKCNCKVDVSNKFCPKCGTQLNGKVDDYFKDKCSKLRTKKRREKNKLLETINGENYYKTSEMIKKLDEEIEYIDNVLINWKHWNCKGDLPSGYSTIMAQ